MKPIAIIGSGLAAYTFAREFRKLDKTTPLLIVTGDDGGFYSKPMLSNALALGKQAQQLVSQTAEQMAAQLNANIITKIQVTAIDVNNQSIATALGDFEFSRLILATGAQAIRLPIEGDATQQVLSVNNLADYAIFREQLERAGKKSHIAILGAGLIGCEFSDDLASAAYSVSLIDPNSLPLAAMAPEAISMRLRDALQAKGVQLKLGTTANKISHYGSALKLDLANGETLIADVVLSAIGLRANISLAQAAQLQTGRGIIVDAYGQTSAANIFALGDCAQYSLADGSQPVLPYIAPIMVAARAIARTLTGEATAIDLKPAAVLVKTPSYPVALIPPPHAFSKTGSWKTEHSAGITTSRFFDSDDVMRGFALAPQAAGLRNALITELTQSTA
ncbi:FAD-dependent oxidoreductase [Undibacterium sp. TJN19]|uniref:FAD-dependent oxidoreductase n=1 Tax=Undibacterium sp. TJN19 TaxID=3413055 RepID=UPI003BF2409B